MKKITFLFALLCASVMGWATQYCDVATGHENNADFGDANGRILLSIEPTANANEYKLTVKPNYANGATKKLDYLYVIAGGNSPYPAEAGTDEGGTSYDELSVTFTNSNATTSFTIQWSNPDWGGRWQCTPTDVPLSTLEACGGSSTPVTKYAITVTQPTAGGGEISANVAEAAEGATVTLTATPASGKALDEWIVTDANSNPITVTNNQFTMPASAVNVTATFKDHDPNEYTAGGHTIHLDASYVGDIYTLVITSTDDMEGLGGSFWNVSGVGTDMRSNSGTNSYTVSTDKKTITCQVQSNSAPNIYTPLYVMMPGEVSFGSVTLNWEDRTPINSEYCSYQGSETLGGGTYIALTWETDPSGNVVITMSNGTGTSSCSFRNGGFEGGINAFVVSTDNFVTSDPASDYFSAVQVYSGNTYTLTKIADLPANAKIKHVGSGHALAWVANGNNQYSFPDFVYTYGGICNQLDAPTNVAVAADSTITFDAVTGASSYTAYVSLSGVEKYHQAVASGDKLHFLPLVDGDYDVTVVASGAGKVDSDPSTAFVWSLTAVQIVLGNSEYCEHIMQTGTNTEAAFTWETDGSGNIVITISETLGGAADASHFRGNALALGNFKVGAGQAAGSNYFSHPGTTTGNQLVLTATTAPAPGEKIYYHGTVEYATSKDGNAWPTLDFEWTYGTVCSGKAVSATPNNNTMGTAVVKKGNDVVTNVEDGDEVSFIATSADAELYRFVNWTKGGVVVSTNATYVTTITESTNLIANFDYIRNTYCHAEINSIQNKKLYMTLGSIGGGQYQIKFEGSSEAHLTALTNANYTVNRVTTDIVDGDKPMSGNDVPFTNARWSFDAAGYGSATMVFGIQDGYTWEDIYVWNHAIYFMTAEGEVGYTGFPDRNHIAWTETCADAEAPVFAKAEGAVLNETSVRLTIQATDNWEGMLQYTIARAGAEPIISNHASGEEFAQEITGLTTGTEYNFTVTVSDGVNNAVEHILVTPVGDETKPVMGEASLASKTWNSAIINVAATDNIGVASFHIDELNADYVASEDKITVTGLTAATEYTWNIKAKDAAGNMSDNSAVVVFTTDAHLLAPATAAPVPTWPAEQVRSLYSDSYDFAPASLNSYNENWWDNPNMSDGNVNGNHYLNYDLYREGMIGVQFANIPVATMEKIHIDIWASIAGSVTFRPITTGGPNDPRTLNLVAQQWNSFDLDMSEFDGHNWSDLYQYAIEYYGAGGLVGEHICVDNVYFYRTTPYVDDVDPTNLSVDVAQENFYSVKLTVSAEDNGGAINFSIMNGENEVAVGAAGSGVETTITVANLTPGTAYSLKVIAKDDANNTVEQEGIAVTTLALPAAAPVPTHEAIAVKAVYSDAYATVVNVENYCEWWWAAPTVHTDLTLGEGEHVLFYDDLNTGGSFGWAWSAANKIDFTGYQKMHLSIYPAQEGTIEIYPVIAPENQFHKTSQTLTAGEWNEVVLDYTDKTFAPLNQIGFVNFATLGEFFLDNVYFYKDPESTRDDSWMAPGELGTVCIRNGAIAVGGDIYELVGKNEEGKIVFSTVPNNEMEPGKPYLFEATSNAMKFFYTSATPATEPDNTGAMKGTFVDLTVTELENVYYFADHALWSCVDLTSLSVPANRAYVKLDEVQTLSSPTPAPGRRYITMGVHGENTATGIEGVTEESQMNKVIMNGHLFIIRGEKLYDATGRMVK